jgi:anti-sigma-K factor RskA
MDSKEYIASGIVELYAMNALSPDEKKEFERLMLLYPEIATELNVVEQSIENYAFAHSLNPRPILRSRILNAAFGDQKQAIVKPIQKQRENYSLTYKYMVAASLAALIVSTFASWFFYTRWDEAEKRYTDLLNEKNELAENYNMVKASFDESMTTLLVMRDENSRMIELNSTDTSHKYMARVYWNRQTHHSYIDVLSLPAPAHGKQFQLWALVGGKPVDAGVFSMDEYAQRVKDIEKADAWAVTLEPRGGSISPTMDQMYLISKSS